MANLLVFSFGIILSGLLPELPSIWLTSVLAAVIFIICVYLYKKYRFIVWLCSFLLGLGYGLMSGFMLLQTQIPFHLTDQTLIVEGRVIGLPQENDRRQLFTFKVNQAYSPYKREHIFEGFPNKINISSYTDLRVKTGETWRLTVKLKRPRGFVNPGGFDYQASLLRREIGATGYIRQGENQILKSPPKFSIDVLRYELQQWLLTKSLSPHKGVLVALLVGDTSTVAKEHWDEMIKTGTNHLIAISGLHLGFFAIVGFFFGNLTGRFIQLVWHKYPSMVSGYILSVLFTLFYSLIAGFNIPTIRTLIMLGVVQLALLWRRSFRARDTLLIALVLVLLYDPLAAYDIGFWLSFSAVAMLIFCFAGRIASNSRTGLKAAGVNHFRIFLQSQWVMFIGLLIPLAIFVHTSSLLAPPANFISIPVITFFVVPCLILSAICHFTFAGAEGFFLHCAEWGMLIVHKWLNYLLVTGSGKFNPLINFNPWSLALAVMSVFLLLLPRGLGNKYVGGFGLMVALVIPLKQLPDLQMLVFDVGQGTAVFLRTPNYPLLYDTGPVYTENFDAGSGIIVPYLQGQGLASLDILIVSHNDADHSGGLSGVLESTGVKHLWMGEPAKFQPQKDQPQPQDCHVQKPWTWDQVNFRFITWPAQVNAKPNNRSCVLLVEYRGNTILLTGDIEKEVERALAGEERLPKSDIVFAPHHGSRTSSTPSFVAQTSPEMVIYSAGFHNQHGHPHKHVKARYSAIGAMPFNTAYDGALEFIWRDHSAKVIQYRHASRRYWFDAGPVELTP